MKFLKDLEQNISEKMSDFYERELGVRPSAVRTVIQGDLIILQFGEVPLIYGNLPGKIK